MATGEFGVTREFDISVDVNSSKGFVGDLNMDGYPDIAISITQSGVKKLAVYTGGIGGDAKPLTNPVTKWYSGK